MYQTAEIRGRKIKSYGENCTRPRLSNSTNNVENSSGLKAAKYVEFHKHNDKRIRDNQGISTDRTAFELNVSCGKLQEHHLIQTEIFYFD